MFGVAKRSFLNIAVVIWIVIHATTSPNVLKIFKNN
jgi:hypothetical protein